MHLIDDPWCYTSVLHCKKISVILTITICKNATENKIFIG